MTLENKKIVFIIAPQNFRDEELLDPKSVLEQLGAKVSIASKNTKQAFGKLGAVVKTDLDYSEVKAKDYAAIIFVGGPGICDFFTDTIAFQLAQDAYAQKKVIAGICSAVSILANSGILKNKKATSYQGEQTNLQQKGALYTGAEVTVDGNIVTANGPRAAIKFGEKIAELLGA